MVIYRAVDLVVPPPHRHLQTPSNAQEMLQVVARFLGHAAWLVRGIAFDAHGSHQYFREALFGDFQTLDPDQLKGLPFFSDVSYESLPHHALPRLPVKVCMYRGEALWALPGPLHASKNAAGQLVSPLHNIHMGKYWCDHSVALSLGLPPSSWARTEPMSDFMNATLWCPWFLVSSPETCIVKTNPSFLVERAREIL